MGSKQMFACPASCQQLLPKHRVLPGARLPSTPFPFNPPPAQETNLPQENPGCREQTQPLLAGSRHYHLVPGQSQCPGSGSAGSLPSLAWPEAPSPIPIPQQPLTHRNNSKPLPHGQPGLVPSHLQVTRHRKISLPWTPRGSPEFPFLLPSCRVVFPQINSNPFLLF